MKQIFFFSLLSYFLFVPSLFAQKLREKNSVLQKEISLCLDKIARQYVLCRRVVVDSILENKESISVFTNASLEDVPFRPAVVKEMMKEVNSFFPGGKKVMLFTRNTPIERLIPDNFSQKKPSKSQRLSFYKGIPLTTQVHLPYKRTKGLDGDHIALWQSHGMYYTQSKQRWEWQRARLFGTVEDLYTQSYVLPFLLPMLEKAGANVMLPRERDTHRLEVIVDNDTPAGYEEHCGDEVWTDASQKGFAYKKKFYLIGENPFQMGTARVCQIQKKGSFSSVKWTPSIAKRGRYAVYVSYVSLPSSTERAHYTIHHLGGQTEVAVNQTMGGSTWIYVGSYVFDKGRMGFVTLTNQGHKKGRVVSADAIKIGGGLGNMARSPKGSTLIPQVSGMPRFDEAARYWLQWAGMPDSIYTKTEGINDYRDDIYARGRWVNYIKNESHIPVDLAFAFHSDAGITPDDSIIGTLGIYCSNEETGVYRNGVSREISRALTDCILSQIVGDVRAQFNPKWERRGMWNQSYIEARVPDVPTMLLELLSHQNFADMCYGLNPRFRFKVSRSIYKGMLKFLAFYQKRDYVVQPLPPQALSLKMDVKGQAILRWQAQVDSLEPTAIPTGYLVYKRLGDGAFGPGRFVKEEQFSMMLQPNKLTSFKVTAVNEGGESFPSEIVSAAKVSDAKACVLVVNGFERISGPAVFEEKRDSLAGFDYEKDFGVPYGVDIAFVGSQYDFERRNAWRTNDDNGLGDCYNDYAGMRIAGNTFDYACVHGEALMVAGYSFVSSSRMAVMQGKVLLNDYKVVDLILGKQKNKTFPMALRKSLTAYAVQGGSLLVSGAYVVSDMREDTLTTHFMQQIFGCGFASVNASHKGWIKGVTDTTRFKICMEWNADRYAVERVNGLIPVGKQSKIWLRYVENNIGAAVYRQGDHQSIVLGFPFETIEKQAVRQALMCDMMRQFTIINKK